MVRGAFRRFDHDHHFVPLDSGTLVKDQFDFESSLGPLGRVVDRLVLAPYMHRFIERRLQAIKAVAESDAWTRYLRDGAFNPRQRG